MDLVTANQLVLERIARAAHAANNEVLREAAQRAAQTAPVVSGRLRDSIHAEDTTSFKLAPEGSVRADAPHSPYVIWGTERMSGNPFFFEATEPLEQAAKLVAQKLK